MKVVTQGEGHISRTDWSLDVVSGLIVLNFYSDFYHTCALCSAIVQSSSRQEGEQELKYYTSKVIENKK